MSQQNEEVIEPIYSKNIEEACWDSVKSARVLFSN